MPGTQMAATHASLALLVTAAVVWTIPSQSAVPLAFEQKAASETTVPPEKPKAPGDPGSKPPAEEPPGPKAAEGIVNPPGSRQRAQERAAMVEKQIARPGDLRTPVLDEGVLEAMRPVPRHVFVPANVRSRAYRDSPLPIGHGQTISQPYMVALMTQLLGLKASEKPKVLEIGTGSGYQAAVLAHLTPNVYTIEIIKPLADRAERTLREQGYEQVQRRHADGYYGWEEKGPFDAIIVTCASGHLPPPLWEQLKPGGHIAIPIGGPYEVQRLVLATKQADGTRRSRTITSVRFVPMTRRERP